MNNYNSSYGNAIEAQARTGQMFTLALIAILIIIVITIRIIVGYFIAKRGNMIIEAKGYFPSDYSVNGMACYLSIFFGTIIAYIFVIWFAAALPLCSESNNHENEKDE